MCDLNIPQNNIDKIHVVLMPSILRVHIFIKFKFVNTLRGNS